MVVRRIARHSLSKRLIFEQADFGYDNVVVVAVLPNQHTAKSRKETSV